MIFGYQRYRPRNFLLQLLSSFKFFALHSRQRRLELKASREEFSWHFKPVPEINLERQCIECELCIRDCPTGALSYTHGRPAIKIDRDACRPCRLCVEICPTNYFSYQNSSHSQIRVGKRMEKFLEG